ncbi:MAG: serine hydrolase, partial [Cyclobacteriaceae bacterium]|nr:serine hydrolase [Cyclobacteriaceae bacterium]
MMKKIVFFLLIVVFAASNGFSQIFSDNPKEKIWVDSVYNTLNTRQKIAQLMMIAAYSNRTPAYEDTLKILVDKMRFGGMIFFQGTPQNQIKMINELQSSQPVPMLIGFDGEWGLGMRLDHSMSFPYQMALGAIQDNSLIYKMGEEIARQCRRVGIHINFAPVADVNNNPENPVINYRSFGENREKVADKAVAYMKGMQDYGVLANAKHFPGHGDTNTDSHLALPLINHSKSRLDSVELYPFRRLIDEGVGSMMIAHLNIPQLSDNSGMPSTLSPEIVTGLLRNELGYHGMIFTDALNMKGVTSMFSPGEVEVRAFKAGNDILLFPENPEKAMTAMEQALKKGEIKNSDLEQRVKKVLRLKFRMGLERFETINTSNIDEDLNTPDAKLLLRDLIESSITLLKNEDDLLPLKNLEARKIATVSIGKEGNTEFQKVVDKYTKNVNYTISLKTNSAELEKIFGELKAFNTVILGLHDVSVRPLNKQGYSDEIYQFINKTLGANNVILLSFRNPYTLDRIAELNKAKAIITTYFDTDDTEDMGAQAIFGGISTKGVLPVSLKNYKEGDGIFSKGGVRFKYTLPEEFGISSMEMDSLISAISKEAMDSMAVPGLQVLIAKDQKVIYHKAFGYHTYDKLNEVKTTDVYDFASVTKITGPLPALMKLHDEGKFDLDKGFEEYFPMLKGSNKGNLDYRNILAHNAMLKAWIPYWTTTIKKNGKFKKNTLSHTYSENFPVKLNENLYQHKDYKQKIYKAIKKSPLNEKPGYLYSGLSFYLYPEIIENLSGSDYQSYLNSNFYHKLGAYTLMYNPSREIELERIIPTEKDTFFRQMQIHGVVHDEG